MLVIRRKPAYADKARSYQIELDGNVIGEVNDGETKKINIAPGEHILKLKIDWTSSPSLKFNVKDKEDVSFLCKSALTGSKI